MEVPQDPAQAQAQDAVRAYIDVRLNHLAAALAARHGLPKPPKPDTFDGRSDPEAWCYGMDTYFAATGFTEDLAKIAFADTLMRASAIMWRRTLVTPPTSWNEYKAFIISAYQSVNPSEAARDQLRSLRQSATVQAYLTAFRAVTLAIPGITDDEMKDRFIHGLKPKIMDQVKLKAPATFEDAAKIAARLDALHASTRHVTFHDDVHHPEPMDLDVNAISMNPLTAIRSSSVNALARPGSSKRSIREPLTDRERAECREKGLCFKCRRQGHVARDCPENSRRL